MRDHLLLDEVAGEFAERLVVLGEQIAAHVTLLRLRDELDQRGVGRAAALAHGLQAVANSVVPHVMEHARHEHRARRAERVAERDRAAERVELALVGAGLGQPRQRHRRERLVDLEHADLVEARRPALCSTFSVAGIGPVSISTGSAPVTAPAR